MANILFPSVRDLAVLPPVVNAINYLSQSNNVTVFSWFGSTAQFTPTTNVIFLSKSPYPKSFIYRVTVKIYTWIKFYRYLFQNASKIDFIWLSVWDYPHIMPVLKISGFKGRTIFQMNELDFTQFKYGKKVDCVIIPDENRAWITYFLAGLKKKPYILPNIPYLPTSFPEDFITEIDAIKNALPSAKVVLYQGTIDYDRRCILELLMAIARLPSNVVLAIMPGNYANKEILEKIKTDSAKLDIQHRVFILKSVRAPEHLFSVKHADIGIGLYRPTSLNQIYAAPNRLYEFSMFGIPQILPNYPYFKMLEGKYPLGINTVEPESVAEITAAIQKLLDANDYNQGKENSIRFFTNEGNFATQFDQVWESIVKNG